MLIKFFYADVFCFELNLYVCEKPLENCFCETDDEETIGKVLSLCVQAGADWLCLKPKASPYHNCSKVLCAWKKGNAGG